MSTLAKQKPSDGILVIDVKAKKASDARAKLLAVAHRIEAEQRAVLDRHRGELREALHVYLSRQLELSCEIKEHAELFVKPRTIVLHGFRCGFAKGKGRIEWAEDDAKIVQRIRAAYGKATADRLIIVSETPSKEALAQLPAHELRKLGVSVVDAEDKVVAKPLESEMDRFIDRVLAEGRA